MDDRFSVTFSLECGACKTGNERSTSQRFCFRRRLHSFIRARPEFLLHLRISGKSVAETGHYSHYYDTLREIKRGLV